MRILNLLLLLASSVTVHAANIIETKTIIINDNFNSGSAGWTGIFADYNQAVVDEGMIAQVTTLPTELGLNGQSGFKLSASNRADDVYQGIYKKVSIPVSPVGSIVNGKTVGAPISIVSSIVFDISIASNAASSCFGVGGAPGSSVYAHFGAASVQPIVAKAATDYWTFTNIDKGQQSQSGPAGSVAGTIGVETDSCDLATAPYVIKPYTSFKPKSPDNKLYTYTSNVATSDLYLLVGTDSAFEARTTIYFVTIKATITATITYAESTNPGPITTTTPPTVKPTVPPSTPLYETKTITINDNFNAGTAGWTGIFADYNQAVVDEGMIATVASLPTELGLNGQSGFKLSASNRADDVYQGVYKKVSIPISPPGTIINGRAIGAPISITSAIVYDVSLASNAADSCLGIGGSPGSSVYAKFGATSVQPVVAKTGSDHWAFTNIDKGQQAMSGPAGSVAGTIGVETECDDAAKYMIKPYTSFKPKSDDGKLYTYPSNVATSDLYLLVGTESAFEGRTTVYFVSVKATITVVITYAEAGSTPSTPKPTPAPTPVLFSTFTITWRNPPRFTESVVRGRIIDRMRIIATIAKVKSQFLIQPQDVVYKSGITVQTWTLKVGFIDGTYTRAQAKSQFLTQLKKDSVIVSTVIISSATTDDEFAVDDNDVESEETLALQSCPDGNLMTADATCPVVETTAVTTSTSSSSNNNLAIILGAAIGGVVLLTLVAVTIVMIRRRRAHTVTVAKMETAPRTEMAMTIV